MIKISDIKRGDIYWTELSPSVGSEQNGCRPSLVIQNDMGNKYSRTVIVAIITKKDKKKDLPTHVKLNKEKYFLEYDSVIMLEQIRTIDKDRVGSKISSLDDEKMIEVEDAILTSLGIDQAYVQVVEAGEIYKVSKKDLKKLGII